MKVYLGTENAKLTDGEPDGLDMEPTETVDPDKATVPQARGILQQLRPIHREAIRRLLEGQTVTQAAKDLGLSRRYLSDLKSNDPLFKAELEKGLVNRDEDVLKRIQLTSYEALDVVREIMRTSKSDAIRLTAAQTILDRAGYSKLEKRVSVVADAETIIRELNRRKAGMNKDQLQHSIDVAVEVIGGPGGDPRQETVQ
jgi:hypothetical protein